jgi:NAD(P)H-hydrate epimerase
MRDIDRLTSARYGTPSLTLMENAANATAQVVADCLRGDLSGKSVLVVCGKGNNGGDGAAVARLLAMAGANITVVLIGTIDESKADARTNFERLTSWANDQAQKANPATLNFFACDSDKGWEQLCLGILSRHYDAVVDALFGTGLIRPVEGIHLKAIRYIVDLHTKRDSASDPFCPIISVDIPSGLNSDSEMPIGETVHADVTVTMTAPKRANVLPPASHLNGKLIVADIDSPVELIGEASTELFLTDVADARSWLRQTRYTPESYKKTHGHVLVIGGSRGFTGAAALCGNAAMRAGSGLVTIGTSASVQPLVATQVLTEVMTTALAETDRGAVSDAAIDYALKTAERVDVVAIGPGLSAGDERTRLFVRRMIDDRRTAVVIDADGLNCLSPWPNELRGSAERPLVLTPHAGEMMRLLGSSDKAVLDDRVSVARDFAVAHEVILLLKGSRAIIAAPDGRIFVNATGNAGLGTAGAGDTLTGVIAGFLAQAYGNLKHDANALDAVIAAVYISGLAGDLAAQEIGMRAMTASDIREHLGKAFCLVDPVGEKPYQLK